MSVLDNILGGGKSGGGGMMNSVFGLGSGITGPFGLAGGSLMGGNTLTKAANTLSPPLLPRLEQATDMPDWAKAAINSGVQYGLEFL